MSHKNGGRMNRKERKFQKQRGKARAKRSSATLGGNARVSFPGIFVKGITMVHGLDIITRMNAERPQVDKSLFALGEFHAACLTGDCDCESATQCIANLGDHVRDLVKAGERLERKIRSSEKEVQHEALDIDVIRKRLERGLPITVEQSRWLFTQRTGHVFNIQKRCKTCNGEGWITYCDGSHRECDACGETGYA